jgi:hypothetical protein
MAPHRFADYFQRGNKLYRRHQQHDQDCQRDCARRASDVPALGAIEHRPEHAQSDQLTGEADELRMTGQQACGEHQPEQQGVAHGWTLHQAFAEQHPERHPDVGCLYRRHPRRDVVSRVAQDEGERRADGGDGAHAELAAEGVGADAADDQVDEQQGAQRPLRREDQEEGVEGVVETGLADAEERLTTVLKRVPQQAAAVAQRGEGVQHVEIEIAVDVDRDGAGLAFAHSEGHDAERRRADNDCQQRPPHQR